jgi:hypothetical protein
LIRVVVQLVLAVNVVAIVVVEVIVAAAIIGIVVGIHLVRMIIELVLIVASAVTPPAGDGTGSTGIEQWDNRLK